MKAAWTYQKVEDFAELCLGKMLDKATNRGTPRPYLRNLNVRWFQFDLTDVLEMPFEDDEIDRYTGRSGDLMVCEGGYPGRAAIWSGEPIFFQKAIHRVRTFEPARARWLLYFLLLSDLDGSLRNYFTGTGIQHFTGQAFKSLRVPLPPLPEQQRIVAILDEAFEGLATATTNAEKNLKNARELFNSYRDAVFSVSHDRCTKALIGDVAQVFDGPHATPDTVDSGPIFLGISALQDGNINLEKTRHVTPEDFQRWTRRVKPAPDDVVFSYETRLGQAGIIPANLECCLGRRMGLVRVDRNKVDPWYFLYQYLAGPFQDFLRSKTIKGATVDRISIKDFPSFPMGFPSLAEQRRVVTDLDTIAVHARRLEFICRRKIAALSELKQSFLQKAFAGELT